METSKNKLIEMITDVGANDAAKKIDAIIYKHSLYVIKDLGSEGQSQGKAEEALDELRILRDLSEAIKDMAGK